MTCFVTRYLLPPSLTLLLPPSLASSGSLFRKGTTACLKHVRLPLILRTTSQHKAAVQRLEAVQLLLQRLQLFQLLQLPRLVSVAMRR